MARIVYLGGETTGAGLRLAGVDARMAAPDDAAAQLRSVLEEAPDCVLLDGGLAACLPPALLAAALETDTPLLAVIPDVLGRGAPPDAARSVRDALGIEA